MPAKKLVRHEYGAVGRDEDMQKLGRAEAELQHQINELKKRAVSDSSAPNVDKLSGTVLASVELKIASKVEKHFARYDDERCHF